ncbi:hypothetical protein AGMMS49928_16860 [Spirochaetia bacterium]|nr:hypothetical protein AGMMS49928_16860 [Spirochaetia bacterium]
MSDINVNPYQSPQADIKPDLPLSSQGGLTETMITYLKEASPWLRFLGILNFIGAGFMALFGIALMVLPSASGIFRQAGIDAGMLAGGVLGVIYIAVALLMFFPARFTYTFGAKIRSYLRSSSIEDLELALKNNKSFWKFNGILAIIGLAFIPLSIIIVIIAVVASL